MTPPSSNSSKHEYRIMLYLHAKRLRHHCSISCTGFYDLPHVRDLSSAIMHVSPLARGP